MITGMYFSAALDYSNLAGALLLDCTIYATFMGYGITVNNLLEESYLALKIRIIIYLDKWPTALV